MFPGRGEAKSTNYQYYGVAPELIRTWASDVRHGTESQNRPDSFLARYTIGEDGKRQQTAKSSADKALRRILVVDPSTDIYYRWLLVISIAVLYNVLVVIARSVFWKLHEGGLLAIWLFLDYLCDFIYLLDMAVQFRTGYLEQGLIVRDSRNLRRRYMKTGPFWLDILSLAPTDLLYLFDSVGVNCTYVRFNRLLKFGRMQEFFDRIDTCTNYPNLFRVSKLLLYILLIIHWNACVYFQMSNWIGFGSDDWVYFNITESVYPVNATLLRMYIYSFYWSTLTLTTIGETPKPERDIEYLFVVVDFLVGVLIFATIVGNVGSMITNMNASRAGFQQSLDGLKRYFVLRNVGKDTERRVIKWFDYVWTNEQSRDEEAILAKLPDTLSAEIAIRVHYDTLKRVAIFQDCEPGLLVQLILKLKLSVFTPGDYVCRKGDIGREMYIVKRGRLSVVGDDGHIVYANLTEGSVFGEVSILNIPGNRTGNRRTANVRSIGYSDLFVLSKENLWAALAEYPEAKKILIERAKHLLRKDDLLDEDVSRRADVEQETAEQQLAKLQDIVYNLTSNLARHLSEYHQSQLKMKQRVNRLEQNKNGDDVSVAPSGVA
ncbi:Cyclic nucleotide-gated cation channel alpha-3 [Lamellibrachia satsuma]|nr:Cyclic nucleotide-gated cation channel alpha-3 [Lamellibrachia satsuma]